MKQQKFEDGCTSTARVHSSVWVLGLTFALCLTVVPASLLTGFIYIVCCLVIGWQESWLLGSSFFTLFVCLTITFYMRHRAPSPPHGTRGPERVPFLGTFLLFISSRSRQADWFYEMSEVYGTKTGEPDGEAEGNAQQVDAVVTATKRSGPSQEGAGDVRSTLERTKTSRVAWQWTVPANSFMTGVITNLNSPANVRHVLTDNFDNYVKAPNFKEIAREIIGKGIFSSDGRIWRMHRKIASHMFSQRMLRESAKVTVSTAQSIIRMLHDFHQPERESLTFDIQDVFFSFTLDVFCEIAFGCKMNTLGSNKKHQFVKAFEHVQTYSMKRFGAPFWRLKKLLWCCCREEWTFRQNVAIMNEFLLSVAESKRKKSHAMGRDLVSLFVHMGQNFGHENEFTNTEVRDIISNFLLAGRDTTAAAMTWTLYELTQHPEAMRKVREEADNVLGVPEMYHEGDLDNMSGGGGGTGKKAERLLFKPLDSSILTYDAISRKLPYIHAVVTEALRLHPSVPCNMKKSVHADTLPDGTLVPAQSIVVYSPYVLGRNPDLYEDPLTFSPERWTGKGLREPGMSDTAVFNASPRLCLGKSLAYFESKLLTAVLVQRFDFEYATKDPATYNNAFVMKMKHGLKVTATPRKLA